MANFGFLVFLAFVAAAFWVGLEIFSYGNASGWPLLGSMALVIPVSGLIVFAGVLVNGALGVLARRR